ncbi:MAG: hypothetical protein FWF06_03825, partial [Symbiobacteriaceae bacterium]|nr:hypothetical protein [Symbiobacteriaceae bacterium]
MEEFPAINDIISKSGSDLIFFFVLVLVALVAAAIPLYTIIAMDRRDRAKAAHEQLVERNESNARQAESARSERAEWRALTLTREQDLSTSLVT